MLELMNAPVQWTALWPDPSKDAAGLPELREVEHAQVYQATPALGMYNHGPTILFHQGQFVLAWCSHAVDEMAHFLKALSTSSSKNALRKSQKHHVLAAAAKLWC